MTALVGCTSKTDLGVKKTIVLNNKLGEIEIRLPTALDSTFSWINETDSYCTNRYMFRFANSKFPIMKETGFAYAKKADSLYDFTIEQRFPNCGKFENNGIDQVNLSLSSTESLKNIKYFFDPNNSIILFHKLDTLRFNGRKYFLKQYKVKRNNMFFENIRFITIYKNEILLFTGRCEASNCNRFNEQVNSIMNSVKIK
jgi:hypothetical protein